MLLINYTVMMEKRSGVTEGEGVHSGAHTHSYLIHLKAGNDNTASVDPQGEMEAFVESSMTAGGHTIGVKMLMCAYRHRAKPVNSY